MKKRIFTINLIVFIIGFSFAQTHSLAYDVMEYEGTDRGYTITEMSDGLLIVSSSICQQTTGCFGIIKTDLEGNEQWIVRFDNYPYKMHGPISDPIKKDNGNYVIGGGIWHNYEGLDSRAYLMEFDSLNTVIWKQEYGDSTYCHGIKELDNGGFLLYGIKFVGNIKRRYFVKTDDEGNMEWEQVLPLIEESASNSVWSLEVLEGGNMLQMVGTKSHTVADGKTLVLMDSDFNTLMSKNLNQYNFPLFDVGNIARKRKDGGYVVPLQVDTITPVAFEAGVSAHVVLGLDSLFNTEWVVPFPAYGFKSIFNIIIAENGDIIGCGTDGTFKNEEEPDVWLNAGWLFRISPQGELIWDRQYYIEEHLEWHGAFDFRDVIEMSDGRIAATGYRLDHREDGSPNGNVWLLIVDENGCITADCDEEAVWITATEEVEEALGKFKQVFFKISPNPASTFAIIDFYNPLQESSQISIYSTSGQLLDKNKLAKGTKKHEIDLSDFPPGIYFITLESNGHILQNEKIIVH